MINDDTEIAGTRSHDNNETTVKNKITHKTKTEFVTC